MGGPDMRKILEGVYRLESTGFSNAYLLEDRGVLTLVDTGPPRRTDRIAREVEGGGFPLAAITSIFLTHYHQDHVGNAAEISALTGARVYIHESDAAVVQGKVPVPTGTGLLGLALGTLLNAVMTFPPVEDPVPVTDAYRGPGPWQVVHVPGHTPGSSGLYHPGKRVFLCGDAVNHRGRRPGPPPRLFTANPRGARDSIRRVSAMDIDVLLPGHGPPIRPRASDRIRDLLDQP